MKKLICAKEVEALACKGEKVMYVDSETLITPSARDLAADLSIEFSHGTADRCATDTNSAGTKGGIDSDVIYNALTALMEKGLLKSVMNAVGGDVPFISEQDSEGSVKLVRSDTSKWEALDTGNPGDKVYYNELVGSDDGSPMNAGFMTIEKCSFPWDVACEELYYVVEGNLTVEKDGRIFKAHPGDIMYFKKGSKLIFSSPDKVKVFYATH